MNTEKTVAINPLKFGMKPVADVCHSIQFQCIYDEVLTTQPEFSRWWDPRNSGKSLFKITKNPYVLHELFDNKATFDSLS